jgi:hypothetical protein
MPLFNFTQNNINFIVMNAGKGLLGITGSVAFGVLVGSIYATQRAKKRQRLFQRKVRSLPMR